VKGNLSWTVFWALVGIFVVIICGFSIAAVGEFFRGFRFLLFMTVSGTAFFLLGVALIILTVREKISGKLKAFFILTGASATGFIPSILLHNAIYGLLVYWFGAGFWDRIGLGDEPFFFIMAVFICPIGFLVGVVGSIILAVRKHRMVKESLAGWS